jgi:hypothetical protein
VNILLMESNHLKETIPVYTECLGIVFCSYRTLVGFFGWLIYTNYHVLSANRSFKNQLKN